MEKRSIIIDQISSAELDAQFEELKERLVVIEKHLQPIQPTEYLTRKELAALLKCDLSSIHLWTKKGKLIPYGIGNRVFFKRAEVEMAVKPLGSSFQKNDKEGGENE